MMYKYFASLLSSMLVIMIASTAFAQPRSSEKAGSELIAKASERIRTLESFSADFSYVMENETYQTLEEMQGSIYSAGDRFHMKLGDNVFVSDGQTIWVFMEEVNEIHISPAEDTETGITPVAILEDLEQNARARFVRQERYEGKMTDIIDLVPNEPQSFYKYRVALDSQNHSLVYIVAHDRHGGTYTYVIKEIRENIPTDPALFRFDTKQYPGAEIIDLR